MTAPTPRDDIDTTPLCWVCGQPMVWTGECNELDMEGGMLVFEDPIYRCVNPDCDEDEECDW